MKIRFLVFGALAMLWGSMAHPVAAATVNFASGTTLAQSVTGIVVDGNTYNVVFTQVPTHAQIAASPFVWTSFSEAGTANTALANALSTAGATGMRFAGFGNDFESAVTWYAANPGTNQLFGRSTFYNGAWNIGIGLTIAPINNSFPFTAQWSVVPIPAALPLLGTALAGLGVMGWRRRKTAA